MFTFTGRKLAEKTNMAFWDGISWEVPSLILFWAFFTLIMIQTVWFTNRLGITPTPTSKRVLKQCLALLPPLPEGKIYELGSGWGGVAFTLARRFPERQIEAYELAWLPYYFSRFKALLPPFRYKNLKFIREDFFEISLHDAGFLFCYLYPGAMERLKKKYERELKPETLFISHTFAFPEWKPIQIASAGDLYKMPIYLYRNSQVNEPAKKASLQTN